jgi:hypothetical protein
MSKHKKTKVIKVTDDPSYFTGDPRTQIPANVWSEFVEWQRQLVDGLSDGGTWIIPAVHGTMTFNKKEKSFSIRLEDYDEDAPSSIFVRNARMNILPKSIDILADIGYKVSNMVNLDGYLLEPIKAAVERSGEKFGKPVVVNIPTMSADEEFDDPMGVTSAVEAVVEAIAETYPDNDKARKKVQERMRKEMLRLYQINSSNEKGMISAMNELAIRIRTKEIY